MSRCTLAGLGGYIRQSSRTRSCEPGVQALAATSRRSHLDLLVASSPELDAEPHRELELAESSRTS